MDDFQQFMVKVKNKSGIDLSQYKENQMKRRLTSLRDRRGFTCFESYFASMEKDQALFDEFLERMTINVTQFFRNMPQWSILEKELPKLLAGKTRIKAWSAACSTGEEPYSLAMLLMNMPSLQGIDIVATDLDENALRKAREASYTVESMKELPASYKTKYFHKESTHYKLAQEVKNNVTFKRHNLLSDPYERDVDLIICRNVMIYFTEETKKEIYQRFADALRPGGLLFVGNTEQIFQPKEFGLQLKRSFFYTKE
ncbi:protein-glutamate O-methyltransferase CheR [Bacillus piscicola]|uniref:CheR family methyltransferase n=1 Tax=Bacillus piscicola TaxID=1632684 RepID=UPI0030844412